IQVPVLERARRRPCRTVHPGCERRIPRLRTLPCCQGELARKPPGIDQPGIEPLLRELAGKRRITLTQVREQARPGRFQRVGDGLHLSVDGDDVGVVGLACAIRFGRASTPSTVRPNRRSTRSISAWCSRYIAYTAAASSTETASGSS